MSKWKLISGIALILILGILIGSVSTGYYCKNYLDRVSHRGPGKAFILERLSKELRLTAEQKDKVSKIIDQIYDKRRSYRLEVKKLMDEAREGLTPDQQKRFDDLRERFRARRRLRK